MAALQSSRFCAGLLGVVEAVRDALTYPLDPTRRCARLRLALRCSGQIHDHPGWGTNVIAFGPRPAPPQVKPMCALLYNGNLPEALAIARSAFEVDDACRPPDQRTCLSRLDGIRRRAIRAGAQRADAKNCWPQLTAWPSIRGLKSPYFGEKASGPRRRKARPPEIAPRAPWCFEAPYTSIRGPAALQSGRPRWLQGLVCKSMETPEVHVASVQPHFWCCTHEESGDSLEQGPRGLRGPQAAPDKPHPHPARRWATQDVWQPKCSGRVSEVSEKVKPALRSA